ncbi:MAG TPA: ankyrin repeat domain-containing protein [bacterium]|nr:ankyrin repeat domain-containing protein [bacterium]
MRSKVHVPLATAAVAVLALIVVISSAAPLSAGDIHRAIKDGDVARVKALLSNNPQLVDVPDETDQWKSLPLHLAATRGNIEIARLLLEAGADIECGDSDESTPLDNAAVNKHGDMVAFLLSKGADVNRRDKNGACALSFAASAGDTAIVQQLVRAGADLNFRDVNGYTLAHLAASRNLTSLLDVLIARGSNLETATAEGMTPLHLAAGRGRVEMVKTLLAHGVNHSPLDGHSESPLFGAAFNNHAEVVRLLLAAGADPNCKDQLGNTPLLLATWRGSQDAMQVLIEHGADVNIATATGDTPILSAVKQGDPDVIDRLVKAGARVDGRDPHTGATPLHLAAILGHKAIAALLLAGGADTNAQDNSGKTPLELATGYGQRDVAELLIAQGARGGLAGLEAGTLAAQGTLARGEAVVWYLYHSGYAVKTKNHLLVFDYFNEGKDPSVPGLCNGHINPKELAGENVMVFATHEHPDHFSPAIFDWRRETPKITYVLGCQPDSAPKYEYMGPRQERTIDGVKITTIRSNDSGVGFWVEADGVVIFHAGDHANRKRDFSGPYKEEIDFLAAKGKQPDIAIMPISGCGFGDQEAVKLGVYYALETLKPRVFIPSHSGGGEYRYADFVGEAKTKFPAIQMLAPQARGDRFRYRGGRIS